MIADNSRPWGSHDMLVKKSSYILLVFLLVSGWCFGMTTEPLDKQVGPSGIIKSEEYSGIKIDSLE